MTCSTWCPIGQGDLHFDGVWNIVLSRTSFVVTVGAAEGVELSFP